MAAFGEQWKMFKELRDSLSTHSRSLLIRQISIQLDISERHCYRVIREEQENIGFLETATKVLKQIYSSEQSAIEKRAEQVTQELQQIRA